MKVGVLPGRNSFFVSLYRGLFYLFGGVYHLTTTLAPSSVQRGTVNTGVVTTMRCKGPYFFVIVPRRKGAFYSDSIHVQGLGGSFFTDGHLGRGLQRLVGGVHTRRGVRGEVTFFGFVHGVLLLRRTTTADSCGTQVFGLVKFRRTRVTRGPILDVLTRNTNIRGGGLDLYTFLHGTVTRFNGRTFGVFTIYRVLLTTMDCCTNGQQNAMSF